MRLLVLATTVCLLVSNVVHAQTNLATNPSFENVDASDAPTLEPWGNRGQVGDVDLNGAVDFADIPAFIDVLISGVYQFEADVNGDNVVDFGDIAPFIELLISGDVTLSISDGPPNDSTVDGDMAAVLTHGTNPRTSGFSQLVPGERVAGRSYLFSASVFFENAGGRAGLVVRTASGELLVSQDFPATSGVWEKIQVRFTATTNERVRLFLRSEDSTGKTYFDAVKLFEVDGDSNLIANQDFEVNGSWNLASNASYSTTEKRFGARSLRLNGSSSSHAAQNVSLGVDTDKPIYTLSAHIKTTGTVPAPETGVDWGAPIEVGTTFSDIDGKGAAFKVDFFNGPEPLRTIYSPYFFSKATEFTERKFSFLPPEGATNFNVTALVSQGNFQAYFDNVQLRKWEVPAGDEDYVDNVGIAGVEAPEAGTYVQVTPFTSNGIQGVVNSVTTTSNPDYGKLVWVAAGNYFQPDVGLRSTTHLKLHKDATLIKTVGTGPSQWFGASVKSNPLDNTAEGIAISDVIVEGGTINNQFQGEDFAGSAVAIYGDRVIVRNVDIPRFSRTPEDVTNRDLPLYSASAIFLMGHHMYVYNNFISGPKAILGQDGIHLWGGTHCHIMSNEVLAGDDGLGLFPGTNPSFDSGGEPIANFNRNISDVEAYNNIFDSVGARCAAVGFANPRTPNERLSSTVSDIRIRNFRGVSGGEHPLLQVQCFPGIGDELMFVQTESQVFDILIQNASLTGYRYPLPGDVDPMHPGYSGGSLEELPRLPPYGIRVVTSDVGSVKDTRFENITVDNFEGIGVNNFSAVVDVYKLSEFIGEIPANENISFNSCTLGLPGSENDAQHAFRISGVIGVEVNDIEASNQINSLGFRTYRIQN